MVTKKRKYISLLLVLLVGLMGVILRLQSRETSKHETLQTVYNVGELRKYYHNSIPGLARAEELELVMPIHKTLSIPDTDKVLKLDRLWYGELGGYILFHVENSEEKLNLGGIIVNGRNEYKDDNTDLNFLESSREDGVIYNGGYYSYAILPYSEWLQISNDIIYEPVLYNEEIAHNFSSLQLNLNNITANEPKQIISLDSTIELERGKLNLIKLQSGISYNRIFFSYNFPDFLYLYGMEGQIFSKEGTGLVINETTVLSDTKANLYYIDTQPFEYTPKSVDMKIHNLILIGKETIIAEIDITNLKRKKGLLTIDKTLNRAYDMDIVLNSIKIDDNNVKLRINFHESKAKLETLHFAPMGLFSEHQDNILSQINSQEIIIPNRISIWNDFGGQPRYMDTAIEGLDNNNLIELVIPQDYWHESNKITISIKNPMLRLDLGS